MYAAINFSIYPQNPAAEIWLHCVNILWVLNFFINYSKMFFSSNFLHPRSARGKPAIWTYSYARSLPISATYHTHGLICLFIFWTWTGKLKVCPVPPFLSSFCKYSRINFFPKWNYAICAIKSKSKETHSSIYFFEKRHSFSTGRHLTNKFISNEIGQYWTIIKPCSVGSNQRHATTCQEKLPKINRSQRRSNDGLRATKEQRGPPIVVHTSTTLRAILTHGRSWRTRLPLERKFHAQYWHRRSSPHYTSRWCALTSSTPSKPLVPI